MPSDPMSFPDPSAQMAQAVSSIAASLDSFQRLARMGYGLVALGLIGVGFLIWHGREVSRQGRDLHQQTRVIVQTNQALLAALLQRTTRQP